MTAKEQTKLIVAARRYGRADVVITLAGDTMRARIEQAASIIRSIAMRRGVSPLAVDYSVA